jgi:hypothetical protein
MSMSRRPYPHGALCASNPAEPVVEVVPGVVEFEVAVPRLTPAFR